MIRVVIAVDQHLVRQGIRALLDQTGDIRVAGEAGGDRQAIEMVRHLAPDVLLLDLAISWADGILLVKQIRTLHASTQVVVLSTQADKWLIRQLLHSGARGYLLKRSVTEELLLAIRAASRGETYLSPGITGSVVAELMHQRSDFKSSPIERLSPREREVLQLIAEGSTNARIARAMKISVKTVEKHRASLMSKLGVRDVVGLLRLAVKHRVIFIE